MRGRVMAVCGPGGEPVIAPDLHASVTGLLAGMGHRVVACSGGVDSLLLSDLAHAADPASTLVVHAVTPAVPDEATRRVVTTAHRLGWRLRLVRSGEFGDERYLANPTDRCFHCKTHLYDELDRVAAASDVADAVLLSGANLDDLGEYRPGLRAAAEHRVRHPFVEAGAGKAAIRELAAARGRAWHDLPAAPCLASRLYSGTRVTPDLLRAVEAGEQLLRELTGMRTVRCRVRGQQVRIEVGDDDRHRVTEPVLAAVSRVMREHSAGLGPAQLDALPYAPGRAFVRLRPPGR
ncbi:adenine nucleotide alpha hydrolase [Pseudonocardia saturnea]|nr:adenine nucleotide alpha hydrolase [Pseudonocardia saturnea]